MKRIPEQLRALADDLDTLNGHDYWAAWSAVCTALDVGNSRWFAARGQNGIELAVNEITRLYEVDRAMKRALAGDKS